MKSRHKVLGLLCLLAAITYLDRVAISVAGPRIQESLLISPEAWGWVMGIFMVAYALFEIPTGRMGDRTGARRVLTRVVLWWSAFTAFTGMTSNYYVLLLTRFFFGAGEAGAFPNIGHLRVTLRVDAYEEIIPERPVAVLEGAVPALS